MQSTFCQFNSKCRELLIQTTWSGVINVEANVTVSNGTTLTIQPGTIVNLGSSAIQIDGALVARGNDFQKIAFNGGQLVFTSSSVPWDEQKGLGSIISKCQISTKILVHEASPIIYASTLSRSQSTELTSDIIVIYGGSPIISNNLFVGNAHSVARGWKGGAAITFVDAANATVTGNTIQNCLIGIGIYSSNSSVTSNLTIEGNLISKNIQGVYFGSPINLVVFANNTVVNNFVAFWVTGFSNQSIVIGNNLYGNSNNTVTLRMSNYPTDMNIPSNWWGTTDTDEIARSIYDSRIDPGLGTVNFTPIIVSQNQDAPKA